jgi:membrane dipeptidase
MMEEINKELIVVDAHCDTLLKMSRHKNVFSGQTGQSQVDLVKMRKGGVSVQFFAAFIETALPV